MLLDHKLHRTKIQPTKQQIPAAKQQRSAERAMEFTVHANIHTPGYCPNPPSRALRLPQTPRDSLRTSGEENPRIRKTGAKFSSQHSQRAILKSPAVQLFHLPNLYGDTNWEQIQITQMHGWLWERHLHSDSLFSQQRQAGFYHVLSSTLWRSDANDASQVTAPHLSLWVV